MTEHILEIAPAWAARGVWMQARTRVRPTPSPRKPPVRRRPWLLSNLLIGYLGVGGACMLVQLLR